MTNFLAYEVQDSYLTTEFPHNLLLAITQKTKRHLPDGTSKDIQAGIRYAISTLEKAQQTLLILRYLQGKSLSEVATVLNLTEKDARQIEIKAFHSLRSPSKWNYIQYGVAGYMRRRISGEYQKGYHLGYCDGYQAKVSATPATSSIHEQPIEMLNLSVRALNCLHGAGCRYIRDVVNLDRDEIWRMRGLGIKTADEIARAILNCGFRNTHWDRYFLQSGNTHTP